MAGFIALLILGCLFTLCPSGAKAAKRVDISGKWLRLTSSLDGKTAQGSLEVSTSGRAGTDRKFLISFYLQRPNGQWKHLYDRKVKKLGVNQSVEVPFSWSAGSSLTRRKVLAILDSDNRVAEKSEANNKLKRVIAAGSAPVSIAGRDQTVQKDDIVHLDGSKSNDPEGYCLTYAWSFVSKPDGSTAALSDPTSVIPTFTADKEGAYVIKLTVNDGLFSNEDTVTISTTNSAPVADAGADQKVSVGATCELNGRGSSDVDGDQLSYTWSFVSIPDGSAAVLSATDAVKPTFKADVAGTCVVRLIVNDGTADSAPDTVIVTTGNTKPLASAGPAQCVSAGDTVTLNGSGSNDADKDPLSYRWSFVWRPAGSSASLSSRAIVNPTFIVDEPGTYVVQLIVNDGMQDSAADTVIITTGNSRPVAKASATATSVTVDDVVSLDGSTSSDADSDPLSYSWSLITLPSGSAASLSDTSAEKGSFTADAAGDYVAQLIVNDGTLKSDPATVLVTAQATFTSVPDVGGKTQSEAQTLIVAANLVVGTVSQQTSDTVKAGLVISQTPSAGTQVEEGSSVALVISKGPTTVSVPDVTGKTQSDAETVLKSAGLVPGTVTQKTSSSVTAGLVMSQDPAAGSSVSPGTSVAVVISLGSNTLVPSVEGLSESAARTAITNASLQLDTIKYRNSTSVASGNVLGQSPAAGSIVSANSSVNLVVCLNPVSGALPPERWNAAPDNEAGVATALGPSVSFLHTGANPVQTGVADTIELNRTAVLRGKVINSSGNPISGVTVSILNHPGLGQTLTRSDGMYDMVVNGGGPLTLNFFKSGLISAQRTVNAPWQDWKVVDDVVLIERDSASTAIDGTQAAYQSHRATQVTDSDGTRQATLLFPPGITATPAGGLPLSQFTVRATEFTVGALGPRAMPAELPPSSSYTYAAELNIEGVAAGVRVTFNKPVQYYLENFMDFPVGTHVPTGYYDTARAAWVAVPDGRVVKIISIEADKAQIDTDGDGAADNMPVDTDGDGTSDSFGIGEEERAHLATLYAPGTELWRIELTHFSSVDMNFPAGPSSNATQPSPATFTVDSNAPAHSGGVHGFGTLNPESRTLTETIGLSGTPFTLNYDTRRVAGGPQGISIPVTGPTVPAELLKAYLRVEVAGRVFNYSFDSPPANLVYQFRWDGIDAYGRTCTGAQPVTVMIGYEYPNYYYTPWGQIAVNELVPSFARMGLTPYNISARTKAVLWSESITFTGKPNVVGFFDSRGIGLGGWALSAHHTYDPVRHVLYLGTGDTIEQPTLMGSVRHIAGTGEQGYSGDGGQAKQAQLSDVRAIAVGPDGSVYIAGLHEVRKVDPRTGIITTVAGTGTDQGELGDNGPATSALLSWPAGISVGPDGSLYIADNGNIRIRRVDPQGIITTVAGDPDGNLNPGGPAAETSIPYPLDVAVTPDGGFFISSDSTYVGIQHVGVDGIITNTGASAESLERLNGRITLGPDESLYVAFRYGEKRVYRIAPNGTVSPVAGTIDGWEPSGDGGPATEANLSNPRDIAVAPDGVIYILDTLYNSYDIVNVIRRIGTDGLISTIAPQGTRSIVESNGGPLNGVDMVLAVIATGPDGTLYFGTNGGDTKSVGKLQPTLPGFDGTETVISSPDGDMLYVFDATGRHAKTLHGLTNQTLLTFGYDASGRLSHMTDAGGNTTTVERDGSGNPTGILGPYGHRTSLAVNGNGYLSEVVSPGGAKWGLGYNGAGGLLTQVISPRDSIYSFEYDSQGFLKKAVDANNAAAVLNSTGGNTWTEVTLTTPEGIATRYKTEYLATGEEVHTTYFADGLHERRREYSENMLEITRSDGRATTAEIAPDPRFGMQAAYVKSATTTRPGGPTTTASATRTVTLTDPNDPFTLQELTDTSTVNGRTSSVSFNVATRTFTTTSAAGRHSTSQIDAAGRGVNSQSGDLQPVSLSYDDRGRPSQATHGERIVSYTYGTDGLLAELMDPLNRTVRFDRDQDGRPTALRLADNRVIGYTRNPAGLMTSLTPPAGEGYAFTWTALGQPDETTLPDGKKSKLNYDLDRKIIGRHQPGSTVTFTYDMAGRLLRQDIGDGAPVAFTYGADGRPATQSTSSQNLTFTRPWGVLTSATWSGLVNGSVSTTYNNLLKRATQTVAGANTIEYSYDADGLLTGMRDPDSGIGDFGITRHPENGWITATQLGSFSDTRDHNNFGELAGYAAGFSTNPGAPLYAVAYVRDNLGRITQTTETIGDVTTVYGYVYDTTGRLIGYTADGAVIDSYTYDGRNNRTGWGAVSSAVYDDGDRMTSQGGAQYTYDGDGRLATVTTAPGQSTVYSYDPLGRLLSVDPPGENNTVSYDYDAMGRRIRRSVNGTVTHRWIYQDGIRPAAELDDGGNVKTLFVYGTGLLTPDYMIRDSSIYRFVTDERGSVRLVVDVDTGTVVQRIDYDPWGLVTDDSNPGFQPFGFAGGMCDSATGLVRFFARDYDPAVGRFTAPDPLLLAGGQYNLYVYAANDPINLIDPLGLFYFSAGIAGSAGIAAGAGVAGSLETGWVTGTNQGMKWKNYQYASSSKAMVFGGGGGAGGSFNMAISPFGDIEKDFPGRSYIAGFSGGLIADIDVGFSWSKDPNTPLVDRLLHGAITISAGGEAGAHGWVYFPVEPEFGESAGYSDTVLQPMKDTQGSSPESYPANLPPLGSQPLLYR